MGRDVFEVGLLIKTRMNFFSDFKELSSWIIGISCLVVILVIVYTRTNKDKVNS